MDYDKLFSQFVHDVVSVLTADNSYYALRRLYGFRPEVLKKFEGNPVHGSAESLVKLLDWFISRYPALAKTLLNSTIDKKLGIEPFV